MTTWIRVPQVLGLLLLIAVSGCVRGAAVRSSSASAGAPARVPYEEFAATVDAKGFMRVDVDRSGTVTPGEWQHFDRTAEALQDFEALDTDRDAEINPYEWQANLGRSGVVLHVFRYLDIDRNDYVTQDEMRRDPLVAALFALTF